MIYTGGIDRLTKHSQAMLIGYREQNRKDFRAAKGGSINHGSRAKVK